LLPIGGCVRSRGGRREEGGPSAGDESGWLEAQDARGGASEQRHFGFRKSGGEREREAQERTFASKSLCHWGSEHTICFHSRRDLVIREIPCFTPVPLASNEDLASEEKAKRRSERTGRGRQSGGEG
jgi:hypothetical protein